MPTLARRHGEITYVVIPSTVRTFPPMGLKAVSNLFIQDIEFLYNVQHDCQSAKCTASGVGYIMQERVQSGLTKAFIEHRPIDRFIVNTHAFHNAHLLRAILPRSLIAPIPLFPNRQVKHFEMAVSLRRSQDSRRAAARDRAAKKKLAATTTWLEEGSKSESKKRKVLDGEESIMVE